MSFYKGRSGLMSRVTSIQAGKKRGKRVNVFLDGKYAFSLQAEVTVKEGLHVGQELSTDYIEALSKADNLQGCLDAATRYLGYRPRSEAELRQRLQRRGFTGGIIEAGLARLREQGLVDDEAFARFWKENRDSFSPRSQWLTGLELRRKGVNDEILNRVLGAIDDSDNAYRAALSKARRLPLADYQAFRRRLGDYLKRRGFNYGIIEHTVARVWQEYSGDSPG